ncbi:MAG: C25 family cysteine peptidase, partial [Candidatus Stygibacter frigidus]|nr:C25 family cysteine peptidase [Candidatus Stygibacter frigidus]
MKILFLIMIFIFVSILLSGSDFSWDNNEFKDGLEVLESGANGVVLTWSTSSFSLKEIKINGRLVQEIVYSDEFLPNDAGFPDLPGISRMIAVPEGASVKLAYEYFNEEIIRGVEIAPAPVIPKETEDGLEYFWGKSYQQDELYPAAVSQISEIDEIRGVDYIMVGVSPFRYNPVKKELHVYRDIKINLSFQGGNGRFGEDRLRSRWWDPVLKGNLLNWDLLPKLDYSHLQANHRTLDYEYLIICPTGEAFTTWADSIRIFRTQQGIRTGIVTLAETGSSNSQIENYINTAYNTWDIPPVAVLFLGDYGTNATNSVNSSTYNNYCISDNLFADVTGNNLPDLSIARITGRTDAELELMIHKFMEYERNPPTNPGFYQNPVVAGGWQTERWFILATEVVRGFWANVLDKSPVREYAIYSGTPGTVWSTATNTSTVVNYFGSNGLGYLGASPAVIPSWNANAASINNDINNGCFMLQHRDHGGETGWGEPDYGNSNLGGLNNEDLAFVFSTNCLTGKFNWSSECFTEAFHRHAQGALGLIAATEVSYSFVNDTYIWGTYDYMWPNFDPGHGAEGQNSILPCFANSSGKWYLQASNWPYNSGDKEVTYYLFHHHGDAFSNVFTEVPVDIAIEYPDVLLSGMTSVNITAEPGTFICLSVGDEILATADGSGSPQSIMIESQLPMTLVHLTATKQDCYR